MSQMSIDALRAQRLAEWSVSVLAAAVAVEVDAVQLRRHCQRAFAARGEIDTDELVSALQTCAHAVGLSLVSFDEARLEIHLQTVELPLVRVGVEPFALIRRLSHGFLVEKPESPPEEISYADAASLVSASSGPWVTASPAAPLRDLAADGHHRSPWERLKALMRLERDDLWVILIYAVAVGLFSLATPIAVQSLVGTVSFGTLLQPILVLSLMLLTALGFQAALRALQVRVVESIQQRVFARTALDLAWRLPRVSGLARREGFGPEAVNRFFDVITVQKTAHTLLTDGLEKSLLIAIGVLVLAFYHPMLLAFAVVLVIALVMMLLLPARRGLATSIDESYAKYEVAAWLEELARSGNPFRGASGATFAIDKTEALTRKYLAARRGHFTVLFGQTVGSLAIQVVASAALLGLGGWLVVQRELTLGQLVAAELIVAAVTSSVNKLGKLLDSTYDLLTSLDKLGHLLDVAIDDEAESSEPVPGADAIAVELRGVPTPSGLMLDARFGAGAKVALTGRIDAPLASWLAAEETPDSGGVLFNQVETQRAKTRELKDRVALVRDDAVFSGTVLENVTVGRSWISDGEVRAALEKVGALDAIRTRAGGLDFDVGHGGVLLSREERIQLLLARAIVGSPRLIVVELQIDALPAATRIQVVAALTRARAPWTLLALVHDEDSPLARACTERVRLTQFPLTAKAPPES